MDALIADQLQPLAVEIESISTLERNPRKGDVSAIAESLKKHGQVKPLVVRKDTREILAGNHTYLAARDTLGWSHVAVVFVDKNDEESDAFVVADNRTGDLATWDYEELAEMLGGLDSLEGTGYTEDDVAALVETVPDLEEILEHEAADRTKADANKSGITDTTVNLRFGELTIKVNKRYYETLVEKLLKTHEQDRHAASIEFATTIVGIPEKFLTIKGKKQESE